MRQMTQYLLVTDVTTVLVQPVVFINVWYNISGPIQFSLK